MNQEIVAVKLPVSDLVRAEGHIADGQVKEVLAVCLFKPGHRDVRLRIQVLGDPAGDAVQLHAVEGAALHALRQQAEEVADAARGFQNIAAPESHLRHRVIDRPDHGRRGIVRVQGGSPGHLILFRRQHALQFTVLIRPGGIVLVKRLRKTAPAHVSGQDLLILRGSGTAFFLQRFQCPDRPDVALKLGLLSAFTQVIVRDMEVCCTMRGNLLHLFIRRCRYLCCILLLRYRCCSKCLRQRFCPERKVPGIPVQQHAQNGLALRPEDGIGHGRIAEGHIIKTHPIHDEGAVIHIDGVSGMQIIGERGRFRPARFPGRRDLVKRVICQVNDNLPHSRNPIMLRDQTLTGPKRRGAFRRLSNRLFSRSFLRFILSGDGSRIRFHLLNERIPGQSLRINQFSVHNSIFRKMFPDSGGINAVQDIIRLQIFRRRAFRIMFFRSLCGHRGSGWISGTRDRYRKPGIGECFPHFRKACLLRVGQIGTTLHQTADMLFHSRPAKLHFLPEAAP